MIHILIILCFSIQLSVPGIVASPLTPEMFHALKAKDTQLAEAVRGGEFNILAAPLVNTVLPPLTAKELLNKPSRLLIPTDLLGLSRLLLIRSQLYPRSLPGLIRSPDYKTFCYVTAVLSPKSGKIVRVVDSFPLTKGTWQLLLKINNHFPKKAQLSKVSFEALRKAMTFKENRETIRRYLEAHNADSSQSAEIGGIFTLELTKTTPIPRIHLYSVLGEGQDFLNTFKSHLHDWHKLATLMRENPAEFGFLPYQYRACMRTLELDLSEEKKKKRVLDFADLFLYMSKNSYLPDSIRYLSVLRDEGTKGLFVADFHVHPLENDASFQDKQNSWQQKVIVLIPRKKGYDLVYLDHTSPYSRPDNVIEIR